jgi:hypothetical protein
VEVFEEEHRRLLPAPGPHHSPDDLEQLALTRFGSEDRRGPLGVGHAEEVEHERHGFGQPRVEEDHPSGDLVAARPRGVPLRDPEVATDQLEEREERDRLSMRDRVRLVDRDVAGPATLGDFEAEPALSRPRLADDAHHLTVSRNGSLEGGLQPGHLATAADEFRETSRARDIEPGAYRTRPFELADVERLADALHLHRAEITETEVAGDQAGRRLGEEHGSGLGELFHSLREPHGVPLRRVVHAEIIADPSDDHLARIEAHADEEVQAAGDAELVGVVAEGVAQVKCGPARALGVVLVGDRGAEERHDAVAGVLVYRALEAVHALGEEGEKAVHDPVPLFGVELLGKLHRALHVGEEDRHLLALAFEGGAGGEDLLGEVLRRVCRGWRRGTRRRDRLPALQTEPRPRRERGAARATCERDGRPAFEAELRGRRILVLAPRAAHSKEPPRARFYGLGPETVNWHGRGRASASGGTIGSSTRDGCRVALAVALTAPTSRRSFSRIPDLRVEVA